MVDFPAFSHDSWCTSCIARRVASPAASTMRFGLCALRSGISRYTYATRDLLPMIMRGWKYAPQEGKEGEEEEEEMGPSPSAIERPVSIDVAATSSSMYPTYRCQTRCSTCSLKRGEARTVAILAPVNRFLSRSTSIAREREREENIYLYIF